MTYGNLTLDQLQRIHAIKNDTDFDKRIEQYSIVYNKSIEFCGTLSLQTLYSKTAFLQSKIPDFNLKKRYGKFQPITNFIELSLAQHKDISYFMESNGNDWIKCAPQLLAVINKQMTITGYKYRPDKHQKNIERFRKSKCKNVLGAVFFYLNFTKNYSWITKDYLEAEELIASTMKTIQEDSGFKTFIQDGLGKSELVPS